MIENRMIGKGVGRSGHHAGAMGESVADFNAMEYLNEYGFLPTSDENRFTRRRLRHGQQAPCDSQLQHGLPDRRVESRRRRSS